MAHPFVARLGRGPILGDGAMGTELYARKIGADQCLDALNLGLPDVIQQIHREYIAAGAEIVETNTFGANRFRLEAHGLAGQARAINRAGAAIAREARAIMGESVFVAGAIGPSGLRFPPLGSAALEQVGDAIKEQVEALVEKGVDLLVFETYTNLAELSAAIAAAQQVCDLPVIAQLSFVDSRRIASGEDVYQVVEALAPFQLAALGVNCGVGPQQALELIGQVRQYFGGPVTAQPNAGFPVHVSGRVAYLATPEYFADFAQKAIAAGASLVGGCCGTKPAHIQAMREAIQGQKNQPIVVKAPPPPIVAPPAPSDEAFTGLAKKLASGEFVVSVEVDPPKGVNPAKALRGVAELKEAGVDLINIGDSPMARVRMSALGLALLIQNNLGVETLVHMTPRDRNLMALQSDLLGMHALGIRHVLPVTGDQLRSSTNPPITVVWDVDSIGLIGIVKRLNAGVDYSGTSIGRPTRFLIGCAVSPNEEELAPHIERFRRKIDAGADFTMSQPLFSMEQLERFHGNFGPLPIPHLLGVVPLESYRQAELLHNEVPGFRVPAEIRERMRKAGDHGAVEGLRIAEEFVEQARAHVSGVYIITSYGRYDAAKSLVRTLKATPVQP
ncbi:MAG TPA: bifunctional homocysteine S-methyltransferase/methylenetetrahydrofolate reductase [Chloroflexota bacterium]|nr:bifunctional homocysteine S-methyltransferase/methylenetetrahydrofolate reductase [Chloroflexota bacterium]